jgi:ribosomal protein S18 acetylase RimI-like enzyme
MVRLTGRMIIREARPGEMAEVGRLRVAAYQAQDLLALNPRYTETLRDLGGGGHGTVLVAAEDDGAGEGPGGKLLGTAMLEPWHPGSEVARRPGEAEVRALAVAPWAQGRGVGRALMRGVIAQAAAAGARMLLLSTQPEMRAAQALYASLDFARLPELDWSPVPGLTLLSLGLPLSR